LVGGASGTAAKGSRVEGAGNWVAKQTFLLQDLNICAQLIVNYFVEFKEIQ
jgi:hypothetical protein